MHFRTTTIEIPESAHLSIGEVVAWVRHSKELILQWVEDGRFPQPFVVGKTKCWSGRGVALWLALREYGCPDLSIRSGEKPEKSVQLDTPVKGNSGTKIPQ